MLKTGTPLWAASCSTSASGPVRTPMAATWRERTRAVSCTDSPRESCSSASPRTIGKPPSSWMPAWKDTRVRVDGFWKSSATLRPSSAREASGSRLSASARSRIACRSSAPSSAPVSRWRGKCGNVRRCMNVLTWNLFHGRAVPPAGRSLQREFAAALAGWEWDVALLQEVPPWWPAELAAEHDVALTSRNALLPVRRWHAERRPDLLRAGGGSANAILVRGGERIAGRARRRLRLWPERRVVHAVRLEPSRLWGANLHAQVHSAQRAQADTALAARTVLRWAGEGPAILGGDFNQRRPAAEGFAYLGGSYVDHVLARGLVADGRPVVLDRGPLSDHAPVLIGLR